MIIIIGQCLTIAVVAITLYSRADSNAGMWVASQILCKLKIAQNRIYNFKRVAGGKTGRSFAYIIQENQSMSSSLSLSAK